jgi:hypothetical protein
MTLPKARISYCMCQSLHWPQKHEFPLGGIIAANLLAPAMVTPLRTLAKRCGRLSPLLAAPAALLLSQGEAKAILTYNIFESGGNVVAQTSGSLNLTGATQIGTQGCSFSGLIASTYAIICSGPASAAPGSTEGPLINYGITGPIAFNGTAFIGPASSVSGLQVGLSGERSWFLIDPTYLSNSPIVSSATFNGTTLAQLGFTTTGLIGTWTLSGTSESIQVIIGAPTSPGATVPGPLPLLGAGAAFGWSRRLRKRIVCPLSIPPQV